MGDSQSIHPRVEGGRARFEKSNTCGKSSKHVRLQRQLAGITKHLEANPRDDLSRARLSTIKTLMAGA